MLYVALIKMVLRAARQGFSRTYSIIDNQLNFQDLNHRQWGRLTKSHEISYQSTFLQRFLL